MNDKQMLTLFASGVVGKLTSIRPDLETKYIDNDGRRVIVQLGWGHEQEGGFAIAVEQLPPLAWDDSEWPLHHEVWARQFAADMGLTTTDDALR